MTHAELSDSFLSWFRQQERSRVAWRNYLDEHREVLLEQLQAVVAELLRAGTIKPAYLGYRGFELPRHVRLPRR